MALYTSLSTPSMRFFILTFSPPLLFPPPFAKNPCIFSRVGGSCKCKIIGARTGMVAVLFFLFYLYIYIFRGGGVTLTPTHINTQKGGANKGERIKKNRTVHVFSYSLSATYTITARHSPIDLCSLPEVG